MRAIAYVRTRKCEPAASEEALSEQRETLIAWINSAADHVVITTYIEDESQPGPRPNLKTAVEVCRKRNAVLLVASCEAIGSGEPFCLPSFDVPAVKLYAPQRVSR